MKATIHNNDRAFLEQTLKFYRNIDKYSALLEIERCNLVAFKNDVDILLVIAGKRYYSFNEGFINYHIGVLRNRLESLFAICCKHKNYNRKIGIDLGIIIPWYQGVLRLSWPAPDLPSDLLVPLSIG